MTQVSKDFIQSVISPWKEISAYETLWAMENIKENTLKEMFKEYTPLETLEKISSQYEQQELFASSLTAEIQEKVNKFLKDLLEEQSFPFSVVVNRGMQYPKNLKRDYPIGLFYYKGDLGILETKCISIVGARKASSPGISRAKRLAKELIAEGFYYCLWTC